MFKRIRNMHPVTGIVIGVVTTLVLSGTAIAVTDTNFTYSTVKTGHLTIHPADLDPRDDESAVDYFSAINILQGNGCYNTGVNLPQGSRIVSVQTSYSSVSDDQTQVYLYRTGLWASTHDWLVYHFLDSTGDARTAVTDTVPSTLRTVWNNTYAYAFEICLQHADNTFYGGRITYTYTNAGD